MPTGSRRIVRIVAIVVAAVGLADAWWIQQWDLVVLFAALIVLTVAAGWGRRSRRPTTLRADLAGWVTDRAKRTGEAQGSIVDLAVSAHRRSVEPDRTSAPSIADPAR